MESSADNDQDLDLVQWLAKMLSLNACPGLKMIDIEQRKFTIPWLNEKSGGLRPGADDTVFIQAWARHKNYTSKFGDPVKDWIDWKSNFRNSLNSWVKRHKNIRRLKQEDCKGFMVCQFEENFLNNYNSVLLQENGEAQFYSERDTVYRQITMHREMTSDVSCLNTVNDDLATPVLEISVRYGIPQSEVKTITLTNKNPACRLFYPSCTNPGVHQFLGKDVQFLHIDLPSVDSLPEFSSSQKKPILSILEELDRGIYLWYHSDDIYVERRCQTRTYVDSHILQNKNLPRRVTRHDDPQFVKVFDYQMYLSHLSQRGNDQPRHDVIFTFGENTVLYQKLCMGHVQVVVTHIQAFNDMNTNLSKNGPDLQIKSTEGDELDRVIELLDNTKFSTDMPADATINQVLQAALIIEDDKDFIKDQPTPHTAPTSINNPEVTGGNESSPHNEENTMMIEVFFGRPSRLVNKTFVPHSQTRCRIFSGPEEIQMGCDNFASTNDSTISLPSEVEASVKDAGKMNEILSKLRRGLHVKYDNGDIYIERRCKVSVFFTDGSSVSIPIPRRNIKEEEDKYIKLFDFKLFKESVDQFKQSPSGEMPSHEVKLTVGHEIKPDSTSPMMNILIHISVCHLPALQHLYQTFGSPVEGFNPLLSNPDSIDRILKIVKDFTKDYKKLT